MTRGLKQSLRLVGLIAGREIAVRLRDRAFLLSAAFLLLIVGASIAAPAVIESRTPDVTLGVVGEPAAALAATAAQRGTAADADRAGGPTPASADALPEADIDVVPVLDAATARERVRDGDLDAALLPAGDGRLALVGDVEVSEELERLVSDTSYREAWLQAVSAAGADPQDVLRAAAAAVPTTELLQPPAHDPTLVFLVSVVFVMLFFFTTFMFGMQIAQSVVEEKPSRIVEIVVAAVPLRLLLTGKILGAVALAFAQVTVLLALGYVGATVAGQGEAARLLLSSSGWFLVFFVLGFIALASLWAATGALAARQEDLQATTVPVQAMLFLPFFAAVYVTEVGPALTTLSYVPFTAPLAMPRRLMMGDAGPWEALLAAGLLLATAATLIIIGRRLYERSVLHVRGRSRWAQAWRRRPDDLAGAA